MSISWFNVLVVLFFGFYYFKSKSLVKSYSSLIAHLDMPEIERKTNLLTTSFRELSFSKASYFFECKS